MQLDLCERVEGVVVLLAVSCHYFVLYVLVLLRCFCASLVSAAVSGRTDLEIRL